MTEQHQHLRTQISQYLRPAKNRGFFFCPLCGSGQGVHQTGALRLCPDGIHVKCFSCDFYGDIFDLAAAEYSLTPTEAFQKVEEVLGAQTLSAPLAPPVSLQKKLTHPTDIAAYIQRCALALPTCGEALHYLAQRGITSDTQRRFSLGYDASTHQLVIPYGTHYYIRRSVGTEKRFFKPPSAVAGPEPLFLEDMLYKKDAPCVFVVESQLCALSIIQVGGHAIALGGGGTGRLLSLLHTRPTAAMLALALDNDEKGAQMTEKLAHALEEQGIAAARVNPAGAYKDPNEALQKEPEAFARRVRACEELALESRLLAQETATETHSAESAAGQVASFLAALARRAQQPEISTGFSGLDHALGGGLCPGLYILGALSSLGKTTFALQMADQVAATGRDVLFFTLEMAQEELMAKSLSRLCTLPAGGETANTVTARAILSGKGPWSQGRGDRDVREVVTQYQAFARHLFFVEGSANLNVTALQQAAQRHARISGTPPVVVLDYLQILAPLDMRATDKQNTDRAVFELKRLSRELETPVLAISSLNRENYSARLSMSAFKESGAIEYSSDVLLGLQFRLPPGADKISQETLDGLKQAHPRELELKILKNRSGPAGGVVAFDYDPRGNLFFEPGQGRVDKRR